MNWIVNVVPPRIRSLLRRETPDNLWLTCPLTGQRVFRKEVEANLWVIPHSGVHLQMSAKNRLNMMFDEGKWKKIDLPEVIHDPLKFRDSKRYTDKLKEARALTELEDSVLVGCGYLEKMEVIVAAHEFSFIAGSLGVMAGEALIQGLERATEKHVPFILFTASGGARMQEGMFSLMQMPRTIVALQRLRAAKLPYIVVFTHPTTGGVTASYAMLGDVHLAEPNALIGFAGQRVIEQTVREKLPEGFQRSEYLLAHGMIDKVVVRKKLREIISSLCHMFLKRERIK